MSDFPSLHRDEVQNTVEIKTCERCAGLFTKQGDVHFCPRCVEKHPWLLEEGTAEVSITNVNRTDVLDRIWKMGFGRIQ